MPTAAEERKAYAIATERDGDSCVRCLRGGVAHRDHRQNRQGGNTVASNLQLLCPPCHGWKTDHPTDATREGYSVPRSATPSRWPARRWFPTRWGTHGLGWAIYDDLGGVEQISDERAAELFDGEHQ